MFVKGRNQREAARFSGLSRETVAKMCLFSLPPGCMRTKPVGKPKLGPLLLPVSAEILEADGTASVKQRYTARRIAERLREETWLLRRLHGGEGLCPALPGAGLRDLGAAGPPTVTCAGGLW